MKHEEKDLEFQQSYQGTKTFFCLLKIKIDIYIFIQGINALIPSIQYLKQIFNNL